MSIQRSIFHPTYLFIYFFYLIETWIEGKVEREKKVESPVFQFDRFFRLVSKSKKPTTALNYTILG